VKGGTIAGIAGNAGKTLELVSGEKMVTSENYLPEKKRKAIKN